VDETVSPAVARLLDRARRIAAAAGAECAAPKEILASILDEADGEAAELLRRSGADVAALRAALSAPADQPANADAPPPPWNGHAQCVLRRAHEIAVAFTRFEPASSQDVLIAILEDPRDLGPVLLRCGLNPFEVARDFHARRRPPNIHVADDDLDWREKAVPEEVDVLRILDANFNRAREALRAVEDFARFALDDAAVCERLKHQRRRIAEIASRLPADRLLVSRQTEADVGTTLSAERDFPRSNLESVAAANLKRAQEALRVLEEYLKLHHPDDAEAARRIRYEVYILERTVLVASRASDRLADRLLYWLCDPWSCQGSVEWTVREAVDGGVGVVQLRDKQSSDREVLALARRMREWTHELGALFIVNDRPDLARLARADGVHLGQDDLGVREARRIVGPDLLIGVSTHNVVQLRQAVADGADYVGVGPVFESKSKEFERCAGLEFVQEAAAETALPAFAIGGVHLGNIDAVLEAGARRVAVCHAICSSEDPRATARRLAERLHSSPLAHQP
jgi:thiamine-phosphate pyrophosphorylase